MRIPATISVAIKLTNSTLAFDSGRKERKEVIKAAMTIANKVANNLGFRSMRKPNSFLIKGFLLF